MLQSEHDIFTDPTSVTECVDVLDSFSGTALEGGCNACSYVEFYDSENISKRLISKYRGIQSASGVDDTNLSFGAPETFCLQNPIPRQPPKFDSAKVQSFLH